jgi:glycosyltransferase involved in cell wall biosynthesis
VLEAMAASIPVIANDSGGTREHVVAGETGWLVAEDADAETLARAMLECCALPEQAAAMAERARLRVSEGAGLETMARAYLEVLAPHERMAPWSSASARAAPRPSDGDPSPVTAAP